MTTKIISRNEYFQLLSDWKKPYHESYLAMYSSQFDGIITDPSLWTIPVDDHVVHRGDGIFEVFKCIDGHAYCLEDHLDKLEKTAKKIGIKIPSNFDNIRSILKDGLKASGKRDALVRMTITRGPGGFTSNPYESPEGILLIIFLKLHKAPEEKYQKGVSVISAPYSAKDPLIATMKTCSYIHNVLVKKAALDAGADYAVCFMDKDGCMTESSTENLAIVSKDGELLAPHWNVILKGSTLTRLMSLAKELKCSGLLKDVRHENISKKMVQEAAEIFICSTTTDVLPVTSWDGKSVGNGKPGPVSKALLEKMRTDYSDPASPFLTNLLD